jgi:hypothetical protein
MLLVPFNGDCYGTIVTIARTLSQFNERGVRAPQIREGAGSRHRLKVIVKMMMMMLMLLVVVGLGVFGCPLFPDEGLGPIY